MKEKIILGTVQLGLPYGINNTIGKPSEQQAFEILDYANQNNIRLLDSADAYGDALNVIGLHKIATNKSFKLINKFIADSLPLSEKVNTCLEIVGLSSLYCYMYHQFSDYTSRNVRRELMDLRRERIIEKVGISLYSLEELRVVITDPEIEVIQLPVNLLDLSQEKESLIRQAKEMGKEIHARSVYLQGLFLKDPSTLSGNLIHLRGSLSKLNEICSFNNVDIKMAALNFVLHKNFIDGVVLGVDRIDQLKENLALIDPDFNSSIFNGIEVSSKDAYLLNPGNWKV